VNSQILDVLFFTSGREHVAKYLVDSRSVTSVWARPCEHAGSDRDIESKVTTRSQPLAYQTSPSFETT